MEHRPFYTGSAFRVTIDKIFQGPRGAFKDQSYDCLHNISRTTWLNFVTECHHFLLLRLGWGWDLAVIPHHDPGGGLNCGGWGLGGGTWGPGPTGLLTGLPTGLINSDSDTRAPAPLSGRSIHKQITRPAQTSAAHSPVITRYNPSSFCKKVFYSNLNDYFFYLAQ